MNKVYFDTDVLIHLLISQEPDKAELAYPLYKAATDNNSFFVSLLCLQEVAMYCIVWGNNQTTLSGC